jgi:hypothetical protein
VSGVPFYSTRKVNGRKAHICDQCRRRIEQGVLHWYTAGVIDGDFSTYREHFECRAAWYTLNIELRDCDDGAPFLCDDDNHEADDRLWMREQFPVVADRLGWPA